VASRLHWPTLRSIKSLLMNFQFGLPTEPCARLTLIKVRRWITRVAAYLVVTCLIWRISFYIAFHGQPPYTAREHCHDRYVGLLELLKCGRKWILS